MATFYCNADTGNDGNDGSSGSPWLTLNYAYDNSTTDDIIMLQSSVASYLWTVQATAGEQRGSRTFQGESSDANNQVLDGANAAGKWLIDGTVVLKNLIFTNVRGGGAGNAGGVFDFEGSADDTSLTISNCIFHNITVLSNINDFSNGLFGKKVAENTERQSITLSSCLIYDIRRSSTNNDGRIFGLQNQKNMTFQVNNCTFDFDILTGNEINRIINDRFSTFASYGWKNNIIYNNTGGTITFGKTTVDSVTYTDLFNITSAPSESGTATNITSDPLFVDTANINYNIRPNSPALDSGTLI